MSDFRQENPGNKTEIKKCARIFKSRQQLSFIQINISFIMAASLNVTRVHKISSLEQIYNICSRLH